MHSTRTHTHTRTFAHMCACVQLEDCSDGALEAFTAQLATILDVSPRELAIDCNFAGSTEEPARRSLLSDRALLQVSSSVTGLLPAHGKRPRPSCQSGTFEVSDFNTEELNK